jgi:hypothetical protein
MHTHPCLNSLPSPNIHASYESLFTLSRLTLPYRPHSPKASPPPATKHSTRPPTPPDMPETSSPRQTPRKKLYTDGETILLQHLHEPWCFRLDYKGFEPRNSPADTKRVVFFAFISSKSSLSTGSSFYCLLS